MRALRRLVTVGCVALLFASQLPAATESTDPDPTIFVRYSGTVDSYRSPLIAAGKRMFREDHIQFALVWRGRLSRLERNATQRFTIELLRGSVQNVDNATRDGSESCTTPAVRRSGAKVALYAPFDADRGSIFLNLYAPTTQDKLIATKPDTWCDTPTVWGLSGEQAKPYLLPKFTFDLADKTETRSFNLSTKPQGPDRERAVLRSTVTVGGDLCPDATRRSLTRTPAEPGSTFGCYVALGDSYSSGEGATAYAAGTATASNTCHRSRNAYPEIVARTLGVKPFRAKPDEESEFAACSGAVIDDLESRNHDAPKKNADEQPQRDHLSVRGKARIKLVTMSFGGNDIGFSRVVADCMLTGLIRQVRVTIGPDNFIALLAAVPAIRDAAADAIASPCRFRQQPLIDRELNVVRAKLVRAYREVAARTTPKARILVVGYPNFFPTTVLSESCLNVISPEDTLWASRQIDRFDALILRAVRDAGRRNVVYVPPSPGWRDHTICDEDSWFVKPEILKAAASLVADLSPDTPVVGRTLASLVRLVRDLNEPSISKASFFHPNIAGHAVLAHDVLARAR